MKLSLVSWNLIEGELKGETVQLNDALPRGGQYSIYTQSSSSQIHLQRYTLTPHQAYRTVKRPVSSMAQHDSEMKSLQYLIGDFGQKSVAQMRRRLA